MSSPVLLSWIATRNDPYERSSNAGPFATRDGNLVPGPTLTLLADPASPYCGKIRDAVFFRQGGREAATHDRVYEELRAALAERDVQIALHPVVWNGEDPTDHESIFEFLRTTVPRLRQKFRGRELLVHLSPGTPSMQTVWVLMAETGFIEAPVTLVKSYRPGERANRPVVAPVHLGIDTFYKRYQSSRPSLPEAGSLRWDPAQSTAPALRALYDEARRVARLKVPVLILGERGTGKTTLAGWIRQWSPWRKEALDPSWPAIACGQYTPETMRSELFGHVRGAFTDAKENRPGLLDHADGDTLFLDEVGDVSRDLQRLLIKALEEKRFQPLGSSQFHTTDFRLLSATNLPLPTLAERVDADFLDRISPFVLRVPPLREVPEVLSELWPVVLEEAARRGGVEPRWAHMGSELRTRVVRALRSHPLAGNLRDLFRVAWRYLAARVDDRNPMQREEAVEWALLVLDAAPDPGGARLLARAFADARPLPEAILEGGPIDPDPLWQEQRRWFATEAARLGQTRPLASVTTVAERTLRKWRQHPADGADE